MRIHADAPATATLTTGASGARRILNIAPGLALAIAVAGAASIASRPLPLVGAPVLGVILGFSGSGLVRRVPLLSKGVMFASRTVLQCAVVLLGGVLSFGQVVDVGKGSMVVMLATVTVCLLVARAGAKWLRVPNDLGILIGVGTAICGASAIAATTSVIKAKTSDVSYAISTIFLFNVAAVLAFPPLGHALGLSQRVFGVLAGTAVNDMSSVVAASTTYGSEAADHAVIVKLARTLLIIPICFGIAAWRQRRTARSGIECGGSRRARLSTFVPWFLVAFVVLVALSTAGVVPQSAHPAIRSLSAGLVTVALSAVGLATDFAALRRAGSRPVLLGLILWLSVTATSLGVLIA